MCVNMCILLQGIGLCGCEGWLKVVCRLGLGTQVEAAATVGISWGEPQPCLEGLPAGFYQAHLDYPGYSLNLNQRIDWWL